MAQETGRPRIGLALSGGGFRASFFHLGVIRRLEELDLMKDVEVISTVSGGSILGGYYLVQFDKEKRSQKYKTRLEMCDAVIQKFYEQVLTNMRMRAMIFAPVFYPISFLRFVLSRGEKCSRMERMAAEFQKKFYATNLRIGDLPLEPKLLINTTSNSIGKRVVFYRGGQNSMDSQTSDADFSQLPLSSVIGASASVPGVFPPVPIAGDVYSDGGVVDNQGLESLFDYFGFTEDGLNRLDPTCRRPKAPGEQVVIICSDASGQIQVEDIPKRTGLASAARSMDILQAGNRNKIIKLLGEYKDDGDIDEFAFFHLSKNLKDWQNKEVGDQKYRDIPERLCSEFITPVARLRTDLDEFDLIESFSLMYHGYTLVNWHIASYCPVLKAYNGLANRLEAFGGWTPSWGPQFLTQKNLTGQLDEKAAGWTPQKKRDFIVGRLDVGKEQFFRNIRKNKLVFSPLLLVASALMIAVLFWQTVRDSIFYDVDGVANNPGYFLAVKVMNGIQQVIPSSLGKYFDLEGGRYGDIPIFFSDVIILTILIYISLLIYWLINRRFVRWMYQKDYKKVSPPGTEVPFP
ncbi:MAG: patatin-like phospholipase family protein [bacterium]|nr:patatin-like phospholipase family protein [bacterium]